MKSYSSIMVKLGGRPEHSHTHCISLAEHSPNHMMCVCMHAFFPTLWTVACQAPLSIEFSGQEYRSGLPFPSLGNFPTQGSNPGLLHCGQILYQLSHKGSPRILEWVASPFSGGSSRPRNQTVVSCIAGGFFTNWAIREALGTNSRLSINTG